MVLGISSSKWVVSYLQHPLKGSGKPVPGVDTSYVVEEPPSC